MKKIKYKIVIPFFLIGVLWLVYVNLFPIYRISDYMIVLGLSLILYVSSSYIINLFIKNKGRYFNTGDDYADEQLGIAFGHLDRMGLLRSMIGNKVFRKQIESLESDSHQIIEFIKKYPDKSSKISQFFLYYLPTTLKLIEDYKELETRGQIGSNHIEGLKRMEEFMGELVVAYHQVLDELCEDKVMETAIDIEVMKKMLQQDNYLDDNLSTSWKKMNEIENKQIDISEDKMAEMVGQNHTNSDIEMEQHIAQEDGKDERNIQKGNGNEYQMEADTSDSNLHLENRTEGTAVVTDAKILQFAREDDYNEVTNSMAEASEQYYDIKSPVSQQKVVHQELTRRSMEMNKELKDLYDSI